MTTPADPVNKAGEIVAGPGKSYRLRRYLMSVLLIAGGLWFLYDGYVGWPAHNQKLDQLEQTRTAAETARDQKTFDELSHQISRMHARYKSTDLLLQEVLGFCMIPIGILFLIRMLYVSRGEFRLKEEVLYAPGHPPVPFSEIREVDKRQWDRKGIAIITYALSDRSGQIRIDDFVYDQDPMDAIYARILRYVSPASEPTLAPSAGGAHEEAQS